MPEGRSKIYSPIPVMTNSPIPLSPDKLEQLSAALKSHWQTPEQYVLGMFQRRDVVLLGEDHAIRHNLLLVHGLIPLLHAEGIYTVGMEFGASEDQAALDQLVGGETYDEALARRLMFNYNVGWAYREYMDVYRAAWAFNRTLPEAARRFRVLNLSYKFNWADAQSTRTPENARKIYPHGPVDAYRAKIVQDEILNKGEKILILTGAVHAFTRYRMPVYDHNARNFIRFEDRNLGGLLYKRAPEQVACILLHHAFPGKLTGGMERVLPAGGAIDQALAGFTDPRTGFDLPGTPFGDLPDDSFYATGYPDFCLSQLADGYIYDRPIARFEGCTVDEAFLTDANWPEAQRQSPDPDWHRRPATQAEYWAQVRGYVDMPNRFRSVR
jgi:hypothetical protein